MPKIALLPKNVAELIAAGEVVERPASVIKELVENSIDAGANIITVEIQRGGISYIRVTDNGCGINFNDVPTAFLRHATSKIKLEKDLDTISTLGFRGEALAAVSSVARVEMLTCEAEASIGTHYCIEGGEQTEYEEIGCPKGTTIIIRDIFYNTPARMKFLKKDISEANACASVLERIALSHPEISFKFIRDSKLAFSTGGDGNIKNTVYSVLGREFSSTLIEVFNESSNIKVEGLTCKPVFCRPTRNNQFTFLNGRLVRSGTVIAAVEQAYKNSSMVGKFPGFVLYLSIPFDMVDVNVHPAKIEVRFSDEKRIFDAVYIAVKDAITSGDTRPQIKLNAPAFNPFENIKVEQYKQQKIETTDTQTEKIYSNFQNLNTESKKPTFNNDKPQVSYSKPSIPNNKPSVSVDIEKTPEEEIRQPIREIPIQQEKPNIVEEKVEIIEKEELPPIVLIGQAFSTYIIVQRGDSIFMIDKHAAHERIIFNNLKKNHKIEVQALISPVSINLTSDEYDILINNLDVLLTSGFEMEDFGNNTLLVRTVPSYLTGENIPLLISEIAQNLQKSGEAITEKQENLFHTVSCKSAIKAGSVTSNFEMKALAEQVLNSKDIMYCPHGRPVAYEISKRDLEKQFGRIQ